MMQNAPPVVQTAGLTKIFKDFWYRNRVKAVDNLDLEIRAGEVFGLLGPNGSGKSTTIKILLGLLYATRGRAAVFGRAPTDVAVKERIGYLPEESYLYRFLNAAETLDYYGRLFQLARPDRRRRVDELLRMVGLERESRRRIGEYSKGMARRIGLAQALINDPDLLILDEPTTGLDPIGTAQIKELIQKLNREHGKTILLSSHLLADVEDVCDRVCILYGGRQQKLGSVRELLSRTELTQITSEKLSPRTIERVKAVIREEENKQVLDVAAPEDRLETFFIRVVREAEQTQQKTSGALGGGGVAAFLTERPAKPGGRELIDSLVTAGRTEPAAAEAVVEGPVSAEAPAMSREVIEQLVTPAVAPPAAAPTTTPPPAAETPSDRPQADQSVIDSLLGRNRAEE